MMKNCWQVLTQPDKLWVRVLRSKYVGDGKTIKFWLDCWLESRTTLIEVVDISLPHQEREKVLEDYVGEDGNWSIEGIRQFLPTKYFLEVLASAPPDSDNDADCKVWGGSKDGMFTIKSAYASIRARTASPHYNLYKLIWNILRVSHESLSTNSWRLARGLTNNDGCPICYKACETCIHLLRDCDFTHVIWQRLHATSHIEEFYDLTLQEWLKFNLSCTNKAWVCTFAIGLDAIWKARNSLVFSQSSTTPNQAVCEVTGRVRELSKNLISSSFNSHIQREMCHTISWSCPPHGFLKLNSDGVVAESRIAACGGVIRDENGVFVFGYSGKIEICSVLQAELWAIYHGLRLIKEKGIGLDLLIESDSEVVVKFLNERCPREHNCYSLVNLIVKMAGGFRDLSCVHIFREANQVADSFAKYGFSIAQGLSIFMGIPSWAKFPLLADMSVVQFPRDF
uniref:Ribonuclease H protein At1g65750 family n=1 Tax=Cajanus cajan TaxID=3821 RepID=A0A151SDN4_CAJCA|nr:Putative ribonuclease H protein At1g65750 family [Cajanus cajan]